MKAYEKYFVEQVHYMKAYKFMRFHHNRNTCCLNPTLSLGIYRQDTQQLVGVAQMRPAFQDSLLLNKYVNEDIINTEYLELHHFAMIKTEERNSESQALSLIVKWIRQNKPEIRLLIAYAGVHEGDYGYIYQASGWEYQGYNVLEELYMVDGKIYHKQALSEKFKEYGNPKLSFIPGLCAMYRDVRRFQVKQFVYIKRIDRKLTPANKRDHYPKATTEYPIVLKRIIYKRNDEVFHNYKEPDIEAVEYYYTKEKRLFSYKFLISHKMIPKKHSRYVAVYSHEGKLEYIARNVKELVTKFGYDEKKMYKALNDNWRYRNKFFRYSVSPRPPKIIKVPYACKINGIIFSSYTEAAKYLGVDVSAVTHAQRRGQNHIKKIPIAFDLF